jgi:putative oxidoreductase
MKLLRTTSAQTDFGLAILRVITGVVFAVHGGQKLFVYGFEGVTGAFTQMGAPLPGITGPLVALLEFFGGIALIAGLLTRFVGLGLSVVMISAILLVHAPAGFFLPNGYEFVLLLLGAALTLTVTGAGQYSVDALLAKRSEQDAAGETRLRRAA